MTKAEKELLERVARAVARHLRDKVCRSLLPHDAIDDAELIENALNEFVADDAVRSAGTP